MKKINEIKNTGEEIIMQLEGTNRAVRIICGYNTGDFAVAELGELDEAGGFVRDVWSESDMGKSIYTKGMIGESKIEEGWNPDTRTEEDWTADDVDWDAYREWVDRISAEMLGV